MSIRDELAEFCTKITYDALPKEIVEHTKGCFMDHVACMLAAPKLFLEDFVDISKMFVELGGREESSIIGVRGKFPCLNATLVNTTIGFGGFDAMHKKAAIHVPAVLFSAAIAVAEKQKTSGRDLILAVVAGTEIMTRVGISLGPPNVYARGFHPTSICGPFGSAAAAGKLLGLTEGEMAEALSIAGVEGAGSSIWAGAIHPPTFTFQMGRAAESGVMAAMLAGIGFTGIDKIFEDEHGFLIGHSESPDPTKLTEALGKRWEIKGLLVQKFCFGPYVLTSIETLHEMLQKYEITPEKIAEITVKIPTVVVPLVGSPEYPMNRYATHISTRYAMAVNTYTGSEAAYSIELSEAKYRKDPRIIDLFNRVNVVGDPALDKVYPGKQPCILTIKTKDGKQFNQRNDGPVKGDPENPLSLEEIETKFNRLVIPLLGRDRASQIINQIRQLDRLDDVSKLVDLWAA